MAAYISCTRYLYYMLDLFDGSLCEISEKDFNDCVVRFRNCYTMHYENNNTKVFYNIKSGLPEFMCVAVGGGFVEV